MNQSFIFQNASWIVPDTLARIEPADFLCREVEKQAVECPEELQNLHITYRRSFERGQGGHFSIRITADDYYKLFVNNVFVGQGPAQGYYFHYHWNEYDITPYLKAGKNEIVAQVYYQGLVNHAYQSGDRRIGLIAAVFEAEKYLFGTDGSWQCAVSDRYWLTHTMGYDTIIAENVDLRKSELGFEACVEIVRGYRFCSYAQTPVCVYSVRPVSQTKIPNGILYDFGGEITAGLQVILLGREGDQVRILCAEELWDTPEKLRYDMRCNSLCQEQLILADGKNMYCQYEYKGFRYAAVVSEENVDVLSLTARVRHYPFDDGYCELQTDSHILKSVWDICKRSIKYGCQETYLDCPTREKGQYLGDVVITAASQVVLTGDTSLMKKSIDDFTQSLHISGGLMAVAPSGCMQEIADYSLQFPILALKYYSYTQDSAYLKENLRVCECVIRHFRKFARSDGLLEDVTDQWNLVDWPENMRDGYDFPLTRPMQKGSGCHNVLNAFYVGCVKLTEQIKDILQIPYRCESRTLEDAFNRAFFCREVGLYTDSEYTTHTALHSNVLPLFFGINRPEDGQTIADFLMKKRLCCGVYMAYFLLKALCSVGREQDALELIISDDENSWYNMVREGATTCFEAWSKDKKHNTSLCHPWASAPISILAEDILPQKPSVGKIINR